MSQAHDFEAPPTPQEAEFLVKRLSSGFTLGDNASATLTPKDDKSLKIATFSLQKYLKVNKNKLYYY
jgi:hypothetical protein